MKNFFLNNVYKTMTLFIGISLLQSCHSDKKRTEQTAERADTSAVHFLEETHLKNVKQLTNGGENAEAYWSFNNTMLTFQHTNKEKGILCDRIFYAKVEDLISSSKKDDGDLRGGSSSPSGWLGGAISSGKGRTTCSFFLPGDSLILYASTHSGGDTCPAEPKHEHGKYLWPVYPSYEIYVSDLNGNIVRQLTKNNFYDAEAVVSPKGDKILFTSDRSGDLELYTMNIDGSDVKQITNSEGYDGGANFSPDGKQIVWRASHFDADSERVQYRKNLKKHLVSPMKMELFIANADGTERKQLTNLGGANWAPNFTPDGKQIIFSTNFKTKAVPFNLYTISLDGSRMGQITYDKVFDAFAMFSYDGKKLVWCSNRNNGGTRNTNIFIADWKE